MNKNQLIFLIGFVVLSIVFLIVYKSQTTDEPTFKPVELEQVNSIYNSSLPTYYDTIVNVGLKLAGIEGISVNVEELSNEAKQAFGGELNAHVRYLDGRFYLFIDPLSKRKAITVISHEIVHMKQYLDGTFKYDDGRITWNGQLYLLEDITYDDRPWETEAFQLEGQLASQISEIVYQ
jgi:hypothetical protein